MLGPGWSRIRSPHRWPAPTWRSGCLLHHPREFFLVNSLMKWVWSGCHQCHRLASSFGGESSLWRTRPCVTAWNLPWYLAFLDGWALKWSALASADWCHGRSGQFRECFRVVVTELGKEVTKIHPLGMVRWWVRLDGDVVGVWWGWWVESVPWWCTLRHRGRKPLLPQKVARSYQHT